MILASRGGRDPVHHEVVRLESKARVQGSRTRKKERIRFQRVNFSFVLVEKSAEMDDVWWWRASLRSIVSFFFFPQISATCVRLRCGGAHHTRDEFTSIGLFLVACGHTHYLNPPSQTTTTKKNTTSTDNTQLTLLTLLTPLAHY